MKKNKSDIFNTWSFAIVVSVSLIVVIFLQRTWDSIEGLYFPYAYELILYPGLAYLFYKIFRFSKGHEFHPLKPILLFFSFFLLFAPFFYLLFTAQINLNTLFLIFNPNLNHMPGAFILPFIYYLVLFTPEKKIKKIASKLCPLKKHRN